MSLIMTSCGSSSNTSAVPPDDNAPSILNIDNYLSVVELVLNSYAGKNYSRAILSGDDFLRNNEPSSSRQTDSDTTVFEYACENDEMVTAAVSKTGNFKNSTNASFNNCLWRGSILSGQMVFNQLDVRFFSTGGDYSFTDFSVVDADGNDLVFNGTVTYSINGPWQSDTHVWNNKLDSLIHHSTTGTRELTNIDTRLFFCVSCWTVAPYSGISGSFIVNSPETGNNALTVNTLINFESKTTAGGEFTVGKMRIDATDGSYIELDADNGNTADITVSIMDDNQTIKVIEPWSSWFYDFNFEIPSPRLQMTAEQREALPTDCLFDFDERGVVYCFSAPTRKFVSMNSDGSVNWDFPLPGVNSSNQIEGISVIDDDTLCIVANVTVNIGDSRHEVSCFELSGAFISTQATLEPNPRIGDPVKPRDPLAINLDDKSLKVASDGSSFYLSGSSYSLVSSADPSLRDSWTRSAGFVARIEPFSGSVLAWHSFPAAEITHLSIAENQSVAVGVQPANDRPGSYQLDIDNLMTGYFVDSDTVLNSKNLPLLMPDVYKAVTGQYIQEVEDQLLGVIDLLIIDLNFGEDNFCTSDNQGQGCEYTYGPVSQTIACPISGSVTVAMSGASSIQGPTKNHSTSADWQLDQCVFQSVETESANPVHSLNGNWRYDTLRFSTTSYEGITNSSSFDELAAVSVRESRTVVSGELKNTDGQLSRSGDRYKYRDGIVNHFIKGDVEISDTRFGYHIDRTRSNGEWVALEFYGEEEIAATLSTQSTAGKPIRITVPEVGGTTGIHAGYNDIIDSNYIFGSMTISADDGSAFSVTALASTAGLGTEFFEYQSSGSNVAVTRRIPSASLYFPFYVTGDDQP